MRKSPITAEQMLKVWRLHNKSVDANLIAETLGISTTSVNRIINIMTAAQNGEDVDAIDGNSYQKQKDFAKKMFGIEEKKDEQPTETHEEKADDITKEFMQKVLLALAWQNELLESLLDSLGVDWKTHCKGVERR